MKRWVGHPGVRDRNQELGRREPDVGKAETGNEAGENGKGSGSTQKCKGEREAGVKWEGSMSQEVGKLESRGKVGIGDPLFILFTPASLAHLQYCAIYL